MVQQGRGGLDGTWGRGRAEVRGIGGVPPDLTDEFVREGGLAMIEYLRPTPPFDFRRMLLRPLSRPTKLVEMDLENASMTRALRLHSGVVPVEATAAGDVERPLLQIRYPDGLGTRDRSLLRDRIRFLFNIDADLSGFSGTLSRTPEWRPLLRRFHGLRPIQDPDLFESMVKTIIGQQLHVRVAATLVERLVDLGGETVEWRGRTLAVFPSPERVAGWSYDLLCARSFSRRKAEYVIDFARAVAGGKIELEALRTTGDEQVFAELMPLRGVGRWTVECFLLFGLGRPDHIPAGDVGIQNAVRRLYGGEEGPRPTEEQVRSLAEAWSPWRSLASYYLWQSLIPEVSGSEGPDREGSGLPSSGLLCSGKGSGRGGQR